jgi:hypothetical protein
VAGEAPRSKSENDNDVIVIWHTSWEHKNDFLFFGRLNFVASSRGDSLTPPLCQILIDVVPQERHHTKLPPSSQLSRLASFCNTAAETCPTMPTSQQKANKMRRLEDEMAKDVTIVAPMRI